ncbi:MAG TPA: hypothetical protein PL163_00410 [Leptospiraceae bacterium]|nr:hypothetical protein [Leptospiraceae bacterium]
MQFAAFRLSPAGRAGLEVQEAAPPFNAGDMLTAVPTARTVEAPKGYTRLEGGTLFT